MAEVLTTDSEGMRICFDSGRWFGLSTSTDPRDSNELRHLPDKVTPPPPT